MAILADQHMHSSFSFDSEEEMVNMIESAISKGLKHITFTEHNDFDYPVSKEYPRGCWELNVDSYLYDLLINRDFYKDKIEIGFGMEIGMQESCALRNSELANSQRFDFLIGSIHMVDGIDTYEPAYFEHRTQKEAVEDYFKAIIKNITIFNDFDILGHMDYIVRSLPGGESVYRPSDYMDYIDAIIDILLSAGKGIELNTSALTKGFSNPNPHIDILKRYKEKGGEIITIGSDAHRATDISGNFDKAEEILKSLGYKYYSIFKERTAYYLNL